MRWLAVGESSVYVACMMSAGALAASGHLFLCWIVGLPASFMIGYRICALHILEETRKVRA